MTFKEAIDLILGDLDSHSPTSRHTYRWHAKNANEWWGPRKLTDVSRRDVQAWVARRRSEVKPATLSHELSFLRRIYQAADEAGFDVGDPTQRVKRPRLNNRRRRVLSETEEMQLRLVLGLRDYSLILFAVQPGALQRRAVRALHQLRSRGTALAGRHGALQGSPVDTILSPN